MSHQDDYQYYLDSGCTNMDHSLGIQNMPRGYHLLLDADGMYFFWMEESSGIEGPINWDKWAVYRGAKAHSSTVEIERNRT